MKKRMIFTSFVFLLSVLAFCFPHQKESTVVGVVVPMEHQALIDIIQGLKEELTSVSKRPLTFKVMNAQGDLNLQRAITQQLIRDRCDVLVPIGTAASQMAVHLGQQQKIVCLAADASVVSGPAQATCLSDELSVHDSIHFLHAVFPHVKKITLVYSSSEKVAKEIPQVIGACKSECIEVQPLMVQALPELYTIGQVIASDSQAVFVLKDHLVVSGIQTLVQQAEKRGIFVMTSDEGSVIAGGSFAIGVKEKEIGRQGAHLIEAILKGEEPSHIAPRAIRGPFPLFINRKSCQKLGIELKPFLEKAQQLGYPIECVEGE